MKVCAGQALPELWGHERGGDTMAVRARRTTWSLGRGTVLPESPCPAGGSGTSLPLTFWL